MASSYGQTVIFNYSNTTGLWGYVNSDGTEITQGIYKKVSGFSSDGYATALDPTSKEAVLLNAKGEIVDLKMKGIIDLDYIGETEKNLERKTAIFRIGKKFGLINVNGKVIHTAEYDKIDKTTSQIVVGKKGTALTMLFSDGTTIPLDANIIDVRDFREGLAPFVAKSKLIGFIDEKGKVAIEAKFESVGYFSTGLAWAKPEVVGKAAVKVGFIEKTGKWVINAKYEMGKEFEAVSKRALVKSGEMMLYVTQTGEEIKVEGATKLGQFEEGLAYAFKGDLVGFVDPSGKWVVQPEYDKVYDFKDGMAQVRKNGLWGAINAKGVVVIPIEFKDLGNWKNGFFPALKQLNPKEAKWGIIDSKGKFVVEPKYVKLNAGDGFSFFGN